MKIIYLSLLSLLLLCACDTNPIVILETEAGNIKIEIFEKEAPLTASNFLEHCKTGTYDNAIFYRVVNNENQPHDNVLIDVIQGGLFHDSIVDEIPVIPHETTKQTGILHLDGTISMARMGPGTASTEFFICLGDQASLDFQGTRNPDGQGFAAFGKVIEGMDVVHHIHQMNNTGQYLDTPISIKMTIKE